MPKGRPMIIGIFVVWSVLILTAFFKYTLSYDPFFGTAKNVIYRYQVRGEIRDRNGQILAYGFSPRKYPIGAAGGPIIGVTSPEIGSEGYIEQTYAEQMIADKKSKWWYLLNQGERGHTLKTTIDKNLQLIAYKAINGYKGAVVIMMLNGEILASVSVPSYDPNKMTKRYHAELLGSNERPFFNRALYGKYEPGSVWKTVIALTLLEKNYQGKAVKCNGSLKVGNREIKCMAPHGLVKDMTDAYILSCNVWFMQNAMSALDDKSLKKSFKRFMIREIKKDMSKEDIALAAIGQGEVLVSPIELARLAATIGNNGRFPVPQIVKGFPLWLGTELSNKNTGNAIEKSYAMKLMDMMKLVVKKGTARGLSDYQRKGYFIAAKTGTSERDTSKGKVNNAVLIGLAGRSKNKPEIAFSIVIEDIHGYGGTVCVPIMKEILDFYFLNGNK